MKKVLVEPIIDGIKLIYPNGDVKIVEIDDNRSAFLKKVSELLRGTDNNGNSYQLDFVMNIDGIGLGYAEILADAGFVFNARRTMHMPEFIKLKNLLVTKD